MKFGVLLAVGVLATATSALAAGTGPQRELTYTFNYGMTENTTVHNSGFDNSGNTGGGGSGVDSYANHNGAKGTITIDVQREQPDHGLVITVAENVNGRSTPAAQCVVWGPGTTICDPSATINPEEYTAMRFLGINFVDPATLDANKHWHFSSDSSTYAASSDYRITKMDGTVMSIDEARKLQYRTGGSTADVNSNIVYDFAHKMPKSVNEVTSVHTSAGGRDRDQTMRVDLVLETDSLAAKP